MIDVEAEPQEDDHHVIKATIQLHDGTSQAFGIDLTGAQYGWEKLTLPWMAFWAQRIIHHWNHVPLAKMRTKFDEGVEWNEYTRLEIDAERSLTTRMVECVQKWLKRERLTMADLLDLSDGEYDNKVLDLLHQCMKGMNAVIGELKDGGAFTIGGVTKRVC